MVRARNLTVHLLVSLLAIPLAVSRASVVGPSVSHMANEADLETAFQLFAGKSLDTFFSYLHEVPPKVRAIDGRRRRNLVTKAVALATEHGRIPAKLVRSYQRSLAPILELHHFED